MVIIQLLLVEVEQVGLGQIPREQMVLIVHLMVQLLSVVVAVVHIQLKDPVPLVVVEEEHQDMLPQEEVQLHHNLFLLIGLHMEMLVAVVVTTAVAVAVVQVLLVVKVHQVMVVLVEMPNHLGNSLHPSLNQEYPHQFILPGALM
jgi:hypothetical protein